MKLRLFLSGLLFGLAIGLMVGIVREGLPDFAGGIRQHFPDSSLS